MSSPGASLRRPDAEAETHLFNLQLRTSKRNRAAGKLQSATRPKLPWGTMPVQKILLANLLQLCRHDLSTECGLELSEHARLSTVTSTTTLSPGASVTLTPLATMAISAASS